MKKIINQIIKFGLVGGIAFIIDYLVYTGLYLIGVNYLIAQIISFIISLTFNYWASIKWVFDAKKQDIKQTIIFVILSVVGLGINELLLFIGVEYLNIHELIMKLIATIIVMIYNFITRKIFIEKKI